MHGFHWISVLYTDIDTATGYNDRHIFELCTFRDPMVMDMALAWQRPALLQARN
jgi:hypothetical protein